MPIKDREQFKQYILESLGEPISKVNVTDQQLENKIDDALEYWGMYHFDGSRKMFLKQMITPSILKVTTADTKNIRPGAKIEGVTSQATAKVCRRLNVKNPVKSQNGIIYCEQARNKDFLPGEIIKIDGKQYQLLKTPDFFSRGIIDEKRIKVPDYILGITRVIPYSEASNSASLFSIQNQIVINDIFNLDFQGNMVYFEQAMEHIDLLQFQLNAKPDFDFSRREGYLYLNCNWDQEFPVGSYVIAECYRLLDPQQSPMLWNDIWLKRYATALVKKQWATNLSKFQNVQLPGGISFNASEMYQSAQQDIERLETEMMNILPPSAFFIG